MESKQISKLKERVKKLSNALEKAKRGESVDYSVLQEAEEGPPGPGEGTPPPEAPNDDDPNLEEPEDIPF